MNSSIQMRDEMCLMNVRRKSRNFDPTTVECCSIVDLSAEDTQERCRARPETCLGGCTRCCARPVASVEEGHDVERVAETMRVQ